MENNKDLSKEEKRAQVKELLKELALVAAPLASDQVMEVYETLEEIAK